jgi:hypothetical protein
MSSQGSTLDERLDHINEGMKARKKEVTFLKKRLPARVNQKTFTTHGFLVVTGWPLKSRGS